VSAGQILLLIVIGAKNNLDAVIGNNFSTLPIKLISAPSLKMKDSECAFALIQSRTYIAYDEDRGWGGGEVERDRQTVS
jgi:hypothetical protein